MTAAPPAYWQAPWRGWNICTGRRWERSQSKWGEWDESKTEAYLPPTHPPKHWLVNALFSKFNTPLNLLSLANLCSCPSPPTMASLSRLLPGHRYTSPPLPSSDPTPKLSLVGFASAPSRRAAVSVVRWLPRKDHARRGSLVYIFDAFLLVVVLFLAGGLICGFSFVWWGAMFSFDWTCCFLLNIFVSIGSLHTICRNFNLFVC